MSLVHPPLPAPEPRQKHVKALQQRLGEPLMGGNRVELLTDGAAGDAALRHALDAATDHLNLQVSMLGPDSGELMQRLMSRCREGVRLNLMVDTFGPDGPSPGIERLRMAGARVCERRPPSRWQAWLHRPAVPDDRRKLIVVDGRAGFIGGSLPDEGALLGGWRRMQLQVQGPIVQRLQRLFVSRWQLHSQSAMQSARYFPPLAPVGSHLAVLAGVKAVSSHTPFMLAMVDAIDSAVDRVVLSTANPTLPHRLLRALLDAARRDITVDLHLPARSHGWTLLQGGRSQRVHLRSAGVTLHDRLRSQGPGTACTVDGLWSAIGAEPAPWPSMTSHAEANLVVLDDGVASQVERALRDELVASRRLGDAEQAPTRSLKKVTTRPLDLIA